MAHRYDHNPSRINSILEAMIEIVVFEGAAAVTIRRVAEDVRISASGVLHHYTSKQRLMCLAAHRVAERRRESRRRRFGSEGLLALLPKDEDELRDEIAWQALREHGRTDDGLAQVCRLLVDEERQDVRYMTGALLDDAGLDAVVSVIDGLAAMMSRPLSPLSPARAQQALADHLRRGRVPVMPELPLVLSPWSDPRWRRRPLAS